MKETDLTGIVAEHIDAINAGDTDRAVATFAEDADVNDNHREFVGVDAIRRWATNKVVANKAAIEVREVLDHYGDTMVRVAYDGTFDRTTLPDDILMTNYFSVRDGKIVSLMIIFD
jgi:SnoaL-like domain